MEKRPLLWLGQNSNFLRRLRWVAPLSGRVKAKLSNLNQKVRGFNKVYGSHARSPSEGIVLLETYWSRPPCFLASSSKVKRVVNSKREGRKHADLGEVVVI